MSLFFWLSGLKRHLSPSANVPSTRSTRRSSRSSQPAFCSPTVRRTRRSSQSSQAAAYSVERLESRQLLSASPVGPETLVNTTTAGSQTTNQTAQGGAIAMDADGDYVVTWTSNGQDAASSDGVYAQRYNAAGVAQGGEFRVNTYTTGNQRSATVAMDAAGDFVVTWTSNGQDGSSFGVYAQRYSEAGVAQGGEFRVNTTTENSEAFSTVAMDAAGDFVVTWTSYVGQDGSGRGVYAQRYNAAGVAQGGEFRVNTTTADDQLYSTVALDADGDFVVTWTSYDQDGSRDGVYAQRYNAAGVKQLGEFQVNTTTASWQRYSTVAMDADGDFVVTWSSYGQDGSRDGVYAQRYNAAGVAQGGEFQVNTTTASWQRYSTVAMDADGDFVVTWSSDGQDGSSDGVYAQRYDESTDTAGPIVAQVFDGGRQIAAGDQLVSVVPALTVVFSENLNVTGGTSGANSVTNPANWLLRRNGVHVTSTISGITFGLNATTNKYEAVLTFSTSLADGVFQLTARDAIRDLAGNALDGDSNGTPGGDFTQSFSIANIVTAGSEFRVNTTTTANQYTNTNLFSGQGGSIAMDADGDYVVTWSSDGQDGGGFGVYAQRYNAAGVAQGDEFQVNTYTTNYQSYSTVAMDASGDFVVTWTSYGQDGSGYGVYAQRYNAAGVAQGGEFRGNTTTAGDQRYSTVAMDADGDFVVTWTSNGQDGSSFGVYAQRYNSAGVAQGGEFLVNTYTPNMQRFSTVAMDADGDFVVTWNSYGQDGINNDGVYAQRYNAAGVAEGGEFRVNTTTAGDQRLSTVAMDASGDFVVTWSSRYLDGDGYGVYAQRYNAAGVAQGGEFQVNTYTTNSQFFSTVAMDASGDFVVTWTSFDQDGSGYGVYAQRYQTDKSPTQISLSNTILAENAGVNAGVGTLSGTDPDANSTLTFSLPMGVDDNALFNVSGSILQANDSFDFERKSSYVVTVRVTDQFGLTYDKAFTITVTNVIGDLDYVVGTDNNDAFVLTYSSTSTIGTVNVMRSTDGGAAVDLGTFPMNAPVILKGLAGTDSVRVIGTAGSDTYVISSSGGLTINGAGLVLNSIETTTLAGVAGDDLYQFDADTALGLYTLDEAGGGSDTVDLSLTTTSGVAVNLGTTTQQVVNSNLSLKLSSSTVFEKAIGGSGNDTLSGNSLANTLTGNAGNDTLTGGSGNDSLVGGLGDDTYVFGTATTLEADTVTEGTSAGTDRLSFSSLTTAVMLSLETSIVQTVHANRTLKLNSASVFENINGGSDNDTLTGNLLGNTLTGNAGNDTLTGRSGNDSLVGGSGDDTYVFGTATTLEADTVTEGTSAGMDRLSFSSLTTDVMLSLETSIVQTVHANRTLKLNAGSVFENINGGSGNDTLTGNLLGNTLTGNGGNDMLTGRSGDDSLVGGLGDDTYVFGTATTLEADTVTEGTSAGTDTLSFSTLTTDVILNLGTTAVQTVHANRTLKLNAASVFENIAGGSGNDTLTGNLLANILVGNAGGDTLNGGGGRDILIGGLGLDTLNGGEDEDIVIAGRTTSDALFSNLNRLLVEWVSVNSYATRISNLRAGVGAPAVSLKATVNVLNDAGEDDSLVGGNGTDWYFRALDDVVTGLVIGEVLDTL